MMRTIFVATFGLLVALTISQASADDHSPQPQPIDGFPDSNTEYSGFSTAGRIIDVNRKTCKVTVHCSKPFYAPWAPSVAICALWPTSAQFIVHVSNGVAITVDGKKAGLDRLAVGQNVRIQYSIYVFIHFSDEVYCGARKIEASSAPTKSR
jgi:hypothetical protein